MNQKMIPLYEALVNHAKKEPISLHVPGHKYGLVHLNSGVNYYNDILKIDATELTGLDDLHGADGVIQDAELLLTSLYNVKRSFFLINGSTVGNLAMILASIKGDQAVFVQRNCHKSIMNGIQLAKAKPIFLEPEYIEDWKIAGGLRVELVKKAINTYPSCKLLILTYPNYYGMINELGEIIELCHQNDIAVLVDEAHGAHLIGSEYFPKSAVELGADIVVHSAHKTLPAMTMGSYLHFNSNLIKLESVLFYLRMLQSSSPSYPIMASLDIARNYLATYTKEDVKALIKQLTWFKSELKGIDGIGVLNYPDGQGDPLKITIQNRTRSSGFQLQRQLEKKGIFTELADPNNVLFVLPLLKEGSGYPFNTIIQALREILSQEEYMWHETRNVIKKSQEISELELNFTKQQSCKIKLVNLDEARGEICAESIIPYPPGVPLLLSGERIEEEVIEQLLLHIKLNAKYQGGEHLPEGKIKVFLREGSTL